MNLIVIDKCSNSCPYCFASHEMINNTTNEMSQENVDVFLSYLTKEKSSHTINIMGGEPFLYNDLAYLTSKLNKTRKVKSYTIFTGGVFKTEKIQGIKPFHSKLSLLFNVNQRKDYKTRQQFDLVHKNIASALSLRIPVAIGFNIYNKNFDYKEIIKYCYDYGVPVLRIAVAKPTYGVDNNNLIMPQDFKKISAKMIEFIEEVIKLEIKVELDCMLPKCFFSNLQLAKLALLQPSVINSLGRCGCGNSFDISCDLSIFRCFATSSIKRNRLTDFETFGEASNYFKTFFDDRYIKPNIYENCKKCEFAYDQTCQGDCLSYLTDFDEENKYERIIENIYHRIDSMDLLSVPDELRKLRMSNAGQTLLAAYYYYYNNQHEIALHYARKTINLATIKSIKNSALELLNVVQTKINTLENQI